MSKKPWPSCCLNGGPGMAHPANRFPRKVGDRSKQSTGAIGEKFRQGPGAVAEMYTPENSHDWLEKQPRLEDVSPIENGDFPASHVKFSGGYILIYPPNKKARMTIFMYQHARIQGNGRVQTLPKQARLTDKKHSVARPNPPNKSNKVDLQTIQMGSARIDSLVAR